MKSIYKWFTVAGNEYLIDWFVGNYKESEFTGVDRVMQLFLEYCARLYIPATRKFMEAFLKTEGKQIIKKYNIKLNMMNQFDYNDPTALEEASRVIMSTALATYDDYVSVDVSDRNFKVDMVDFNNRKLSERTMTIMSDVFPRLTNGDYVQEMIEDMETELDSIMQIYNNDYLDKLDFLEANYRAGNKQDRMKFITKTGLPCIDGDLGGIYEKMLIALAGSPGAGKTRIGTIHFAYKVMLAGYDVRMDELELQKFEIENMLIAHHIINLYGGKIKIPDSVMNKGEMSEEQERYYEAAKIDLFESGKYGRIDISTEPLIVENIEKEMYTYLKKNKNCKFWLIDYAGLAQSKPKGKFVRHLDEYEVITELYKKAKDIINTCSIGCLVLNQFNREGVAAAQQGKKIVAGHVQGGMIIERHADYDIALCRTIEQESAGMGTLSTIKKRAAAGFDFIPYILDLSVSIFRQMSQNAVN